MSHATEQQKKLFEAIKRMTGYGKILHTYNGKEVTLILPGFGAISHSVVGQLDIFKDKFPVIFQVSSIAMSTIFTVDDVDKLPISDDGKLLIYLRSPKDYVKQIIDTHHIPYT